MGKVIDKGFLTPDCGIPLGGLRVHSPLGAARPIGPLPRRATVHYDPAKSTHTLGYTFHRAWIQG